MQQAKYDTIGRNYCAVRQSDKRIRRNIEAQLIGLRTILNVGAGAGSYESPDFDCIALEPSLHMIAQRNGDAAPCVCGQAEELPFPENSFDVAQAILTVHHWGSLAKGIDEMKRVAKKRIVVLTWDPEYGDNFWLLRDYLPQMMSFDIARFPPIDLLTANFESTKVIEIPVPHDCTDGFLSAYWRRPEAYLDKTVRQGISSFQQIAESELEDGLRRLQDDLESGEWRQRYDDLLDFDELDIGFRLVVGELTVQ